MGKRHKLVWWSFFIIAFTFISSFGVVTYLLAQYGLVDVPKLLTNVLSTLLAMVIAWILLLIVFGPDAVRSRAKV